MATGRIVRVNREKGFGFIQPDGGGEDHFFHMSAMARGGPRFEEVSEGAQVRFEAEAGPKGPRATDVTVY